VILIFDFIRTDHIQLIGLVIAAEIFVITGVISFQTFYFSTSVFKQLRSYTSKNRLWAIFRYGFG